MAVANLACCTLNQWALDFEGNLRRVVESITRAKGAGAKLRSGPELELCGYGCEDHFLESDTVTHCWESLARILDSDATDGILCDIGMPVVHKGAAYNCRIFCLNREILLVRPKIHLADSGNYRETRYFAPWGKGAVLESTTVPYVVEQATGQKSAAFGIAIVECCDGAVSAECCEELWTPRAPHIELALDGVDIFCNGSGSYHELRKLNTRVQLVTGATSKSGGVYLYSNQRGCDGGRLYFDGSAMVAVNGKLVGQTSQFGVSDVEVLVRRVDLEAVRYYRATLPARSRQASTLETRFPRVKANLCLTDDEGMVKPSPVVEAFFLDPMEEIAFGPACWLWDFLRRSGASGFFLPLSGGADSSAVGVIVGSMCQILMHRVTKCADEEVLVELERVLGTRRSDPAFPQCAASLANSLLHTCYMGSENSSSVTRGLAQAVAADVGGYHLTASIDAAVSCLVGIASSLLGFVPRFSSQGGSAAQDLALQNVQARVRMVVAYLLAALLPSARGKRGFLLVLGTGNVDETLRGYLTKYDCSSADLNPIGSISKVDLKAFLSWAAPKLHYLSLGKVLRATPTAELRPSETSEGEHSQTDESDMGMTYSELSVFGRLRKVGMCGPVSMFRALSGVWCHLGSHCVAEKVKHFFRSYAANRHKVTVLTPAYHAEAYSPDDHRFDHRPFLYPRFERQFAEVDRLAGEPTTCDQAAYSAPAPQKLLPV